MAPDLLDAYKKMNSSAISLKRISKRYGPKEIIHNLSFDVEPGEIVGFLGPNGAGKTTTMKMIAGTSTATSGTVRVAGFDMATQPEEGTKRLGYLPEHPPLYDILKVSGFLNFIANAKGIPRRLRKIELDKVIEAIKEDGPCIKKFLKPVETVLDDIPALALTEQEARKISFGQNISVRNVKEQFAREYTGRNSIISAMCGERLVALVKIREDKLCPFRVINL